MSDIQNMNWAQKLGHHLGIKGNNPNLVPTAEDVAAFSEALKGANTEIANLKAQITGLQNQTETGQNTVASLTAENNTLKTQNEGLTAENKNLKAENETLKAENQKFADASKSKASFAVLETDTKQTTNRSYVDANAPHNQELQAYLTKLK